MEKYENSSLNYPGYSLLSGALFLNKNIWQSEFHRRQCLACLWSQNRAKLESLMKVYIDDTKVEVKPKIPEK